MSNSGTGYLLGSFRFSSASDSGHQDNNGWGGYGFLAHIIHDGSSAPLPHPPPFWGRVREGAETSAWSREDPMRTHAVR